MSFRSIIPAAFGLAIILCAPAFAQDVHVTPSPVPLPTLSTPGGVLATSIPSHNFVNGVNTSTGALEYAQPGVGDLSGLGTGVGVALGNPTNGTGGLVTFGNAIAPPGISTLVNDLPVWNNTTGTALNDIGDFGPRVIAPSGGTYTGGYYLGLPFVSTADGGDVVFGDFASYAPHAHLLIGCHLCEVSENAAGTTAFVGTDGTTNPILGAPGAYTGTGGLHMAALGPSVDCEGNEAVCIGHLATTHVANSVVIGFGASNTGSAIDTLIGEGVTDTGGSSPNVSVQGTGFGAGSLYGVQLSNYSCPRQTNAETVEFGYGACASAAGHVVVGGSFATAFYAGSESRPVPIYSENIFSIGNAPGATDYGTCSRNSGSWVGGDVAGTFTANGSCATNGTYEFNLGTNGSPTHAYACVAIDISRPAVVLAQNNNTGGKTIAFTNVGPTSVANGDAVQVTCPMSY